MNRTLSTDNILILWLLAAANHFRDGRNMVCKATHRRTHNPLAGGQQLGEKLVTLIK